MSKKGDGVVRGSAEIERTFDTIPDAVIKFNGPHDFLDYSLSYHLPETKDRIADAVNGFYTKIGKYWKATGKKQKKMGCM